VASYARAGAAAVSILTEPSRFDGSLDDLALGCRALAPLSVPAMRGWVPRYAKLKYSGYDEHGKRFVREVSGFHARVVQHEVDHLDGVLYPMRIKDFTRFGFNDALFPGQVLPAEE
jgi:hypothetical protein